MAGALVFGGGPCYGLGMKRCLFFVLFWLVVLTNISWAQDKKVEVFVTTWCPFCQKLENFLKNNRIDYKRYDVEKDAEGSRLFSELGIEGVPVTRIDSTLIQGYDREGIMAALQGNS